MQLGVRNRSQTPEKKAKKLLGKRKREDTEMENGEQIDELERNIRGSLGKNRRSLTPSQRKISVQKVIRDRTASRREGTDPQRLDYKPVPEEHIRLAKKINKMWKHRI